VWTRRAGGQIPGFTCCQPELLTNPVSELFERIDFVWTSNLTLRDPVIAITYGDVDLFRTPTEPRLWPADHAGVITELAF
jgi:hypothetical protein